MSSLSVSPQDAQVGDALPGLAFGPVSRTVLALYAGASGDHNPIHIDIDFARSANLPDVFAHGMLSFGVLSRAVTQWCGIEQLRTLDIRFASMTQVQDRITCRGEVTERFEAEGEQRLRLAVTAATDEGRVTLSGEAVIAVASTR